MHAYSTCVLQPTSRCISDIHGSSLTVWCGWGGTFILCSADENSHLQASLISMYYGVWPTIAIRNNIEYLHEEELLSLSSLCWHFWPLSYICRANGLPRDWLISWTVVPTHKKNVQNSRTERASDLPASTCKSCNQEWRACGWNTFLLMQVSYLIGSTSTGFMSLPVARFLIAFLCMICELGFLPPFTGLYFFKKLEEFNGNRSSVIMGDVSVKKLALPQSIAIVLCCQAESSHSNDSLLPR